MKIMVWIKKNKFNVLGGIIANCGLLACLATVPTGGLFIPAPILLGLSLIILQPQKKAKA